MKSFAQLFKKYRLRSEFETISAFCDALAEKGYFYEESIFYHWQKGTRMPNNRHLVLTILKIFVERDAIKNEIQANELLSSTEFGYLTKEEAALLFHNKPSEILLIPQRIALLNKILQLCFILLAIIGIILFSIYSFIDLKNILIFVAFIINFSLTFLLYLKFQKTLTFISFLVMSFSISTWCLTMIFYRAVPIGLSIIAAKILYFTPVFGPSAFLLFGLFYSGRKPSMYLVGLIVFSTLFIAILALVKDAVIVNVVKNGLSEKRIIFGWAYYSLYVYYYPSIFLIGYCLFLKRAMSVIHNRKRQLLSLLLGMGATSFLAMITNLLLPTFGNFSYNWLGQVYTIFWIGGAYLAIKKYRLLHQL